MLTKLRAMALFSKVAELGSFRGAAQAYDLSPAVVSHHISKLEESLGRSLFYRTTRSLTLTDEGRAFLNYCMEMTEAAQAGLDLMANRNLEPTGTLRITAGAILAEGALPRAVARFARSYPKLQVSVSFSDQKADLIREGFDLAIRVGWVQSSDYHSRKIYHDHRAIYAAPSFLAAHGTPSTPAELQRLDWVRFTIQPETLRLTQRGTGMSVEIAPHAKVVTDHPLASREFVLSGAGFGLLPFAAIRDHVERGELVTPMADWAVTDLGVHAIWPSNARSEGVTTRLVDFLAGELARDGDESGDEDGRATGAAGA
jgi:DNA-binding transcriptional LysR family regulator